MLLQKKNRKNGICPAGYLLNYIKILYLLDKHILSDAKLIVSHSAGPSSIVLIM